MCISKKFKEDKGMEKGIVVVLVAAVVAIAGVVISKKRNE